MRPIVLSSTGPICKYLGRVLELPTKLWQMVWRLPSLLIGSKRSFRPAPFECYAVASPAAVAPVASVPAPDTCAVQLRRAKCAENEEPSCDSFDLMAGASSQQAPESLEQRTVQVEGAQAHQFLELHRWPS